MKNKKIKIENFQLLQDFELDVEDKLSLVVGKNNYGKTSLLPALDKFLNQSDKKKFSIDDFNSDFKKDIANIAGDKTIDLENFNPIGIKLKLLIEYTESDDLSNISKVMMDLDPANNFIVLGFEYVVTADNLTKLRVESKEILDKEKRIISAKKETETKPVKDFYWGWIF